MHSWLLVQKVLSALGLKKIEESCWGHKSIKCGVCIYVVVIKILKVLACTPHILKNILNFGLSLAMGYVSDPQACGHVVFEKSISGPPRSGSAFGHLYIGGEGCI